MVASNLVRGSFISVNHSLCTSASGAAPSSNSDSLSLLASCAGSDRMWITASRPGHDTATSHSSQCTTDSCPGSDPSSSGIDNLLLSSVLAVTARTLLSSVLAVKASALLPPGMAVGPSFLTVARVLLPWVLAAAA